MKRMTVIILLPCSRIKRRNECEPLHKALQMMLENGEIEFIKTDCLKYKECKLPERKVKDE